MSRVAFVIGGRGFVGSHTVRALLGAGWLVHVYGPPMATDLLKDIEGRFGETEGSVEDTAAMAAAMVDAGANVVLSFAAFASGSGGLAKSGEIDADRAFDINVTGLRRTFDAALQADVNRVLWASSTTLYGPASLYDEPIDENAVVRPQGVYGLTKAIGEQVSQYYRDRHGLETVAVRLPLVFGPGLWYEGAAAALMTMLRAARRDARFALSAPDVPFDLMYVTDCAEALVEIAGHDTAPPERLNINGFTTSFSGVAHAAERATPGYRVDVTTITPTMVYPLIRSDLILESIGYAPRYDLDAAVRDFIEKEGASHA